jgi:hypothetical protein
VLTEGKGRRCGGGADDKMEMTEELPAGIWKKEQEPPTDCEGTSLGRRQPGKVEEVDHGGCASVTRMAQ